MEKIHIISNPGSASKKYSVYKDDTEIAWFHFEMDNDECICSYKIERSFEKKHITALQYKNSLSFIIENLLRFHTITNVDDISVCSVRTVIPNIEYVKDMVVTPEIIENIKELMSFNPIHIPPIIKEIESVYSLVASNTPIYLISDSSFHCSASRLIPIQSPTPLQTIGYHGLSCESVLEDFEQESVNSLKMIVCHLGGGSSISGIVNKKSVYNSMDYSPLAGVCMSTRSGSVDPFLIIQMMDSTKSVSKTLSLLYEQSGLLLMSGVSGDLRNIREAIFSGNVLARTALNEFINSIVSYICVAASYTKGFDTLVFTGTIGFRAAYVREMIAEKLSWLGVIINHNSNNENSDSFFEISAYNSKIKVYVVLIDEMKMMHNHVRLLLSK